MALITFSPFKRLLTYLKLEVIALLQSSISQRTSSVASTNTLELHSTLTSGTLTIGYMYEILTSGGTFTNVGAADNNVGTQFAATGTTPTSWGTGSLASAKETWDGATITVSGTTNINTISRKFFAYGNKIHIIASGAFTLVDTNGSSGDDCELVMKGGANVTAAAGEEFVFQLRTDDKWHETYPVIALGGNPTKATVGNSAISGVDGDYLNINSAVAAGFYNLEIVGGVLQTADTVVSSQEDLNIIGAQFDFKHEIDFSTYKVTPTASDESIQFEKVEIRTATVAGTHTFGDMTIIMRDCRVHNNNNITYGLANGGLYSIFDHCRITTNNKADPETGNSECTYINCYIVGGGANTDYDNGKDFVNCTFGGSWNYISSNIMGCYSTVSIKVTPQTTKYNIIGSRFTNGTLYCKISNSYSKVSDCEFKDLLLFGSAPTKPITVSNCTFTNWSTFVSAASFVHVSFVNCTFVVLLTIQQQGASFSQCLFIAGGVVDADDVNIINCKVGVPGGAAQKITVNTVDGVSITDCKTEVTADVTATPTNFTNVNEKIW